MINRRKFMASLAATPVALAVPVLAVASKAVEEPKKAHNACRSLVFLKATKDNRIDMSTALSSAVLLSNLYGQRLCDKVIKVITDQTIMAQQENPGHPLRLVRVDVFPDGHKIINPGLCKNPAGAIAYNKRYNRPLCNVIVSMGRKENSVMVNATYYMTVNLDNK